MKTSGKIILSGNDLKVRDIGRFLGNAETTVEIASENIAAVERSRKFLEQEISKRIIYGVNTGFGPMASHIINGGQLEHLQENLIRSHATGMGDPINEKDVLAAMVIRLNTLMKGYSGVTRELA